MRDSRDFAPQSDPCIECCNSSFHYSDLTQVSYNNTFLQQKYKQHISHEFVNYVVPSVEPNQLSNYIYGISKLIFDESSTYRYSVGIYLWYIYAAATLDLPPALDLAPPLDLPPMLLLAPMLELGHLPHLLMKQNG